MDTQTILAIVTTTAAITIMTSYIGTGIFLQHANAAVAGSGNCNLNSPNLCTFSHYSSPQSQLSANNVNLMQNLKGFGPNGGPPGQVK